MRMPFQFAYVVSVLMSLCFGGEPPNKSVENPNELRLCQAAARGDLKTVKELLASGVNIEALGPDSTPLASAVLFDREEVVEYLLSKGANLKGLPHGQSHLTMAAANGNERLVKMFLANGLDPNIVGNGGITPMHTAKNKGVAAELLKAGGKLTLKTEDGSTPLHYAVRKGNDEATKFYIESGADVNAQDKEKKTALDYAKSEKTKDLFMKHEGKAKE
jgi:ankyrin repeat protein